MTHHLFISVRTALRISLAAAFLSTGLAAAPIISFEVTSLGTQNGMPLFQENFTISGFTLPANFELDINFDPTVYTSLSNGVADSDFNLLLFQPNQPPGAPGVYSALASKDNPSLAGPFSVDFTTALGAILPNQPYFVFDDTNDNAPNGGLVSSGFTTPMSATPEPPDISLAAIGLILVAARRALRRLPAAQHPEL